MNKFVVHCKRDKYDCYIGRPSKWGNPFPLTQWTRNEAIRMYKEWFNDRPELIEAAKKELKGKILGCWCAPEACHGDILSEIANKE